MELEVNETNDVLPAGSSKDDQRDDGQEVWSHVACGGGRGVRV